MFGEKGIALVKEISDGNDIIKSYNSELIEDVTKEICSLVVQNRNDAQTHIDKPSGAVYLSTVRTRHIAIQRNVRCLLSYYYNRLRLLRNMRWEFGTVLPPDIKTNLSKEEIAWFTQYSSVLTKYMRSIGDEGAINLNNNMKPPKSLYIEVRCLVDYGKHQLNDGSIILIKKNSRYYLPRNECESFVRLGIFQHISN